jgi:hypothetical protein
MIRMAKELSFDMEGSAMSSLLAAQPGGAQALAELKKESAKMSGLPVLQVTRVGVTADGQPLPPPSSVPLAQSQNQGSTAGSVTQEVAAGTATQEAGSQISRLGTFRPRALQLQHGRTHAPCSVDRIGAEPGSWRYRGDAATAGVLLESQTQLSGFSEAAVDTSGFRYLQDIKQSLLPWNTSDQNIRW